MDGHQPVIDTMQDVINNTRYYINMIGLSIIGCGFATLFVVLT